jgi:signal transduction histidine kinase
MKQALPKPLLDYWHGYTSAVHQPVYLQINKEGRVISYGGKLAHFGLNEPLINMPVEEEAIFLTGLLPLKMERMILPNLETTPGVIADIHLFKEISGITWVLLLDTTEQETKLRAVIQKSNELQLKEIQYLKLISDNIPAQVLNQMNTALFRILPENRFEVVGSLPEWFAATLGRCIEDKEDGVVLQLSECYPFLEYFLDYEAAKLWEQPGNDMITSGPWTETDEASQEYFLEASALWVKNEKILLVRQLDFHYNNFHNHIQTGRERSLAFEKLNKSKQLLKSFMADMSHELRTPLNAILGYSQMISKFQGSNLTEKQLKGLKLILFSGQRILTIINSLLDLSRIEAGKTDIVKAPLSLDELFEELENMMQALIREKDITFCLKVAPSLPRLIITDGEKLNRVLVNLLGNAAKFTKKGEIRLSTYSSGTQLYFFVKDTGIGISKEHLEEIFESYAQVEGSKTRENRQVGSTGLGLTLCKKLVSLLGGNITVSSELGEGSVFSFYIPLETPRKVD